MKKSVKVEARFLKFVELIPFHTCWEWTGSISKNGYGKFSFQGESRYAHRISYQIFVGPIPIDLTIDHLCKNTTCVNPKHLETVPLKENIRRAYEIYETRTHCDKGHRIISRNSRGGRFCRICRIESRQSARENRRQLWTDVGRFLRQKDVKL